MSMPHISLNKNGERYLAALLLSLPALIGLLLFHYWPIIDTFRLSLLDYRIFTGEFSWIGADNYVRVAEDEVLRSSLTTTLLYFVFKVPVQMAIALLLAILVSQPMPGQGLLRTLILLPTVTSMVVASTTLGMMMHPDNGLINGFLSSVGLPEQGFLSSTAQALPSIAGITIWKEVGMSMLFYLAGLTTIPRSYYEAARVDGASNWHILRFITVPLLRRTHIFVLITTTIAAFKVFVPVKVLTDGGPSGVTRVVVLYIYDLAFRFNQLGYAATVSVILALILIVISIIQLRVTKEEGDD